MCDNQVQTTTGTVCVLAEGNGEQVLRTVRKFAISKTRNWSMLIVNKSENVGANAYKEIQNISKKSKLIDYTVLEKDNYSLNGWSYFSKVVAKSFSLVKTRFVFFCNENSDPQISILDRVSRYLLNENIGAAKGLVKESTNLGVKSDVYAKIERLSATVWPLRSTFMRKLWTSWNH